MKKIDKMLIGISLFGYLAFAVSFLLMPIDQNPLSDEIELTTIISGIMFWSGFAVGILPQLILTIRRRKWLKVHGKKALKKSSKPKKILGYFKNPIALIFYIITIIAIIGLAISINMSRGTGLTCYIFISIFVFAVCYHFVFNGKNYIFLLKPEKIKERIINKKNEREENDDAEDKK